MPILVQTIPNTCISLVWAATVSNPIQIGSTLQIDIEEDTFEVERVLKRTSRKVTIACISKKGTRLGVVIDARRFRASWKEVILHTFPFLLYCFSASWNTTTTLIVKTAHRRQLGTVGISRSRRMKCIKVVLPKLHQKESVYALKQSRENPCKACTSQFSQGTSPYFSFGQCGRNNHAWE